MDLCIETEAERVKSFTDKWNAGTTPEIRRRIEREDPLEVGFSASYTLNGKELRVERASGMCYIPDRILSEGERNTKEARAALGHYNLDSSKAWVFRRHYCPWGDLPKQREIKSLSVGLEREPEVEEGIHLKNPSVGDEFVFIHPFCGSKHTLTVR